MKKLFLIAIIVYLVIKSPFLALYVQPIASLVVTGVVLLLIIRTLFRSGESERAKIRRMLKKYNH